MITPYYRFKNLAEAGVFFDLLQGLGFDKLALRSGTWAPEVQPELTALAGRI
ncbi:MAG: hypothetical protein JRI57_07025 [Deltaproteobacteria bacterium]|nr:hypothetical protein [Deltaproteobacteria bacterium]MBW1953868.1 hypothetical protein [Deltaproteobacteria bacterium]MBW1985690.1 hypothetical protein [Deltaproteobacteria bacterium]MBW2134604.1 hypothetical protein [Deltaproteobacteria bacterium]